MEIDLVYLSELWRGMVVGGDVLKSIADLDRGTFKDVSPFTMDMSPLTVGMYVAARVATIDSFDSFDLECDPTRS
eukprot:538103-Prymnesium_polylepis.2